MIIICLKFSGSIVILIILNFELYQSIESVGSLDRSGRSGDGGKCNNPGDNVDKPDVNEQDTNNAGK